MPWEDEVDIYKPSQRTPRTASTPKKLEERNRTDSPSPNINPDNTYIRIQDTRTARREMFVI